MRIEYTEEARTPLCRLRLTFGALRAPSATGRTPMVVALPWSRAERTSRVIHLDPGERLDQPALQAVKSAINANLSAVVACASLADAVVAFGDLAEAAGYPIADTREAA